MTRRGSREAILRAAETLVREEGAARLTLDAVAANAGVSKGGLLYNFSTKEALLQALVERMCEQFDEALHVGSSRKPDPAALFLAYVAATIDRSESQDRVAGGLLAAVAHDPDLLKPVRSHNHRWLNQMEAFGSGFAKACMPWLAAEGLWLLELMLVSPFSDSQRQVVRAEILRLARNAIDLDAKSHAKPSSPTARKRRKP